jgi:hypothetical protein
MAGTVRVALGCPPPWAWVLAPPQVNRAVVVSSLSLSFAHSLLVPLTHSLPRLPHPCWDAVLVVLFVVLGISLG